jgi:hypothetical protein
MSCYMRTDGRAGMTTLIDDFRKFANSRNWCRPIFEHLYVGIRSVRVRPEPLRLNPILIENEFSMRVTTNDENTFLLSCCSVSNDSVMKRHDLIIRQTKCVTLIRKILIGFFLLKVFVIWNYFYWKHLYPVSCRFQSKVVTEMLIFWVSSMDILLPVVRCLLNNELEMLHKGDFAIWLESLFQYFHVRLEKNGTPSISIVEIRTQYFCNQTRVLLS